MWRRLLPSPFNPSLWCRSQSDKDLQPTTLRKKRISLIRAHPPQKVSFQSQRCLATSLSSRRRRSLTQPDVARSQRFTIVITNRSRQGLPMELWLRTTISLRLTQCSRRPPPQLRFWIRIKLFLLPPLMQCFSHLSRLCPSRSHSTQSSPCPSLLSTPLPRSFPLPDNFSANMPMRTLMNQI